MKKPREEPELVTTQCTNCPNTFQQQVGKMAGTVCQPCLDKLADAFWNLKEATES